MNAILDYLEYVGNQLMGIGIVDVIDILIVAFLFYWIYKFVRDRRAGKLLIGVVFLAVLLLLSDFLDMRALNFILNGVFSVGIVAIVIVFQPELRSALEKVGGESLRNIKGRFENDENDEIRRTIRETSIAAASLSETKTGALIVFERSTRLGDYTRSGTKIDASVSAALIGNIFVPNTPLHDGAVIIRHGRIDAAGCFLPLSSDYGINKALGTRHRAAIGMTENSDAVVVVVSEENGVISVAVDGDLRRHFTEKTLEDYLGELLLKEEKKHNSRVKGKFFRRSDKEQDVD